MFGRLLRSLAVLSPLAGTLLGGTVALPASAQTAAVPDAQRAQIEAVIRDYLTQHPDVIVDALEAYQAREQAAESERQKQALTSRRKDLYEDTQAPVLGNPKGDVTVVEFFDYQCGYCKAVLADTMRLIEQDTNVRLVMKEFPILGPNSVLASRAALAAHTQGKYLDLHKALMAHKGQLDADTVMKLAKSAGIDTDQLKKDMDSTALQKSLQANIQLADALGIRGTPGFVIGNELVPGAIRLDEMKKRVAAARGQ